MNTLCLATQPLQRWFNLLFPVIMILMPALFVLPVKTVLPESVDRDARRSTIDRWRRLLLLGTAICLAIHSAVVGLWPDAAQGGYTWVLFFPLWFGAGMQLLRAKRPSLFTATHQEHATRAASLVPRDREVLVPSSAWATAIALWAALALASLLFALGGEQERMKLMFTLVFSGGGLFFLVVFGWCTRCVRREPEPRNMAGSRDLDAAYARLRRRRAWAFYACGVMGMVTFGGLGLASTLVLPEHGGTLGLWGGIIGTVIGIAGGVIGSVLGLERAKLTEKLHGLQEQG